jgi:hypothetical protein
VIIRVRERVAQLPESQPSFQRIDCPALTELDEGE